MIGFEKLAVSQIKSMCWALAKKIIKERRLRRGEEVVCLQSIKTSDEQTESIYSHVFVQNDDHDTSDEDDEASKPPKKIQVHGWNHEKFTKSRDWRGGSNDRNLSSCTWRTTLMMKRVITRNG